MQKIYALTFFIVWAFTKINAQTAPFVLGVTHEISSTLLSEKRLLNVYMPEGYVATDTTKYPVLYVLDGSANEDFVHICGLVQFFVMSNLMPKTIVVGIANVDRRRDFTFPTTIAKDKKDFPTTGGSARFIAFLAQEVQPFIQKTYKTNAQKTIIGQSLGGLLATQILLEQPTLFTQYIIVSPSLWWDNESLLSKLKMATASTATIYIAVGKEGKIMERDAKNLAKTLTKPKNKTVHFDFLSKEDHRTILHQAVYQAFRVLYAKK
jgi:uncharacterized protein